MVSKEKAREYRRRYYLKNKDEILRFSKEYWKKHPEKIREYQKNWRKKNPEGFKKQSRNYIKNLRKKALIIISNGKLYCKNCGCDDYNFLEINHKNLDGKNDRNRLKFHLKIKRGERKIDDLEILCKICNILHFIEYKYGRSKYKIIWHK